MAKPQRYCIFCGKTNITKEHIWPVWASPHLPKFGETTSQEYLLVHRKNALAAPPQLRTRPGATITKKVRVVCKMCNNTWMSSLEVAAKPVLIPLMAGTPHTLLAGGQETLAQWIACKILVAEQSVPHTVVTRQATRSTFYQSRTMPTNFNVWIGCSDEQGWNAEYFRETSTGSSSLVRPADVSRPNIHTVTIAFNRLLVHVFAMDGEGNLPSLTFKAQTDAIIRIWPPFGQHIEWPPKHLVSRSEAEELALAWNRITQSSNVRWV